MDLCGDLPHPMAMTSRSPTHKPRARRGSRISADPPALIERAAAKLKGRATTELVASAAQGGAHDAVEQAEQMHLSPADQLHFALALLGTPPLNEALERAFERRRELLGLA